MRARISYQTNYCRARWRGSGGAGVILWRSIGFGVTAPDDSAAGDDPGDTTGVRSVAWVVFEWSLRAVLPTEDTEDTEPQDLRLGQRLTLKGGSIRSPTFCFRVIPWIQWAATFFFLDEGSAGSLDTRGAETGCGSCLFGFVLRECVRGGRGLGGFHWRASG